MVALNLACGRKVWPGFDNSDIAPFDERVRYVDLDTYPLPYEDESADLIMISHGLCNRPAKLALLREIARILRPGGWLRIDDNVYRFPDPDEGIDPDEEPMPVGVEPFPPEMRMERRVLVRKLIKLGFEVHGVDPEESMIPADEETLAALVGNHQGHRSFTIEAEKL